MKAFLWEYVVECSDNYHSEGAVLIEAETLERAREIAFYKQSTGIKQTLDKNDWELVFESHKIVGVEKEPDAVFTSDSKEEKVWIFENAGCC